MRYTISALLISLWLAASTFAQPNVKPSLPLRGPGTGQTSNPSGPTPNIAVSTSWEGLHSDFLWEPPDTHGAAGPNGIIEVVNVRIAYFDKSGNLLWES